MTPPVHQETQLEQSSLQQQTHNGDLIAGRGPQRVNMSLAGVTFAVVDEKETSSSLSAEKAAEREAYLGEIRSALQVESARLADRIVVGKRRTSSSHGIVRSRSQGDIARVPSTRRHGTSGGGGGGSRRRRSRPSRLVASLPGSPVVGNNNTGVSGSSWKGQVKQRLLLRRLVRRQRQQLQEAPPLGDNDVVAATSSDAAALISDAQCLFVSGLILDPKRLFGREHASAASSSFDVRREADTSSFVAVTRKFNGLHMGLWVVSSLAESK